MKINENKNIVFVIPSLQPGGMERVMSILLWETRNQLPTASLHLVLYGINRDVFYEIPEQIKIHRPQFKFNNKRRTLDTLKTLWFLRKKISNLNPDAILSFGERWNNLVLLAGLGRKWPIYVSDRCQPDLSLGPIQDVLRKWLYPKAMGVIAQTSQAKAVYQQMYRQKNLYVIGNPIKQVNSLECAPREKIILNIGRLIDSKHHVELIHIFLKINKPDWKLVIVGGNALKQNNFDKLNSLIKQKQSEKKIILTGPLKDVNSWYRKASIFAFPSSSEGFPNVIAEALAYGLPVVAFDCIAGPRDLIEQGKNGFLIKNLDFKSFEERLEHLMVNEKLRKEMSTYAGKSVEKFDEEYIAKEFLRSMNIIE